MWKAISLLVGIISRCGGGQHLPNYDSWTVWHMRFPRLLYRRRQELVAEETSWRTRWRNGNDTFIYLRMVGLIAAPSKQQPDRHACVSMLIISWTNGAVNANATPPQHCWVVVRATQFVFATYSIQSILNKSKQPHHIRYIKQTKLISIGQDFIL